MIKLQAPSSKSKSAMLRSLFAIALLTLATPAFAQLQLRDIVRVKGQEENTLQGLGLVVGLNGNGDREFSPTARALATLFNHMGSPVATGPKGQMLYEE